MLHDARDCAAASAAAEQLRTGIGDHPYLDSERQLELPITVSIGLSCWRSGDQLDDLLRRADQALYVAKAAGRDRVETAA